LANLLWGDRLDAQARQSLRQALVSLRKQFGEAAPEILRSGDESVCFEVGTLGVDVIRFCQHVQAARFEEAAALYRGDLLAELADVGDSFDTWLESERYRLHDMVTDTWAQLGRRRLENDDAHGALEAARLAIELDPLRESTHRLLMQAYTRDGRRADAVRHYQSLEEMLSRELGTPPDPETRELVDRIRGSEGDRELTNDDTSPLDPSDSKVMADRPSLAVLPFENMSGDQEQDYFADGITDDIITGLSKSRMFFVVARNSTFTYKGINVDVRRVARELGVQYVVEGSVRRVGNRVRITCQLIDASADKHVWAQRYDRELEDVFAVQDEITTNIVTSIAPEYLWAEKQRTKKMEPRNFDAWDNFIRAYWHMSRFTREDNAAARLACEQAIELDPHGSGQYGLLSVIHTMDALYDWSASSEDSFRAAREAAETAVNLDDRDSMALRTVALVHMHARETEAAVYNIRRAIDLDPSEAENYAVLGGILGVTGDYDAALEHIQYALKISPRDAFVTTWYNSLAMSAIAAGKDEEAVRWAARGIQERPQFPGNHRNMAAAYGLLGRGDEARVELAIVRTLLPHMDVREFRDRLPFPNPLHLERYLDGLAVAGLKD
jgi:TolB-like protein/two-component SAPR family response regulator